VCVCICVCTCVCENVCVCVCACLQIRIRYKVRHLEQPLVLHTHVDAYKLYSVSAQLMCVRKNTSTKLLYPWIPPSLTSPFIKLLGLITQKNEQSSYLMHTYTLSAYAQPLPTLNTHTYILSTATYSDTDQLCLQLGLALLSLLCNAQSNVPLIRHAIIAQAQRAQLLVAGIEQFLQCR